MAGGWTPSIHLWSHSKGSIKWDGELGAYVPDQRNENCRSVGACAGDLKLGSGVNIAALPTDKDPPRIKCHQCDPFPPRRVGGVTNSSSVADVLASPLAAAHGFLGR